MYWLCNKNVKVLLALCIYISDVISLRHKLNHSQVHCERLKLELAVSHGFTLLSLNGPTQNLKI